jgi:hypothetical protein
MSRPSELNCYRDGGVVFVHDFADADPPSGSVRVVANVPRTLDVRSVVAYDGEKEKPSYAWTVSCPVRSLGEALRPELSMEATASNKERSETGVLLMLSADRAVMVVGPGGGLPVLAEIERPTSIVTKDARFLAEETVSRLRGFYSIAFSSRERIAKLTYACANLNWREHAHVYYSEADQDLRDALPCTARLYVEITNNLGRALLDVPLVRLHGGNQGPRIIATSSTEPAGRAYSFEAASAAPRALRAASAEEQEPESTIGEVGLLHELRGVTVLPGDTLARFIRSAEMRTGCRLRYYVHIQSEYDHRPVCDYELELDKSPWPLSTAALVSVHAKSAEYTKLMASAECPPRPAAKGGRLAVRLGRATELEVLETQVQQKTSGLGKVVWTMITFNLRNRKKVVADAEIRVTAAGDKHISISINDNPVAEPLPLRETYFYALASGIDPDKRAKISVTYQK